MDHPQLDNLVRIGQLKAEPIAQSELHGLVRSGVRRLKDAALQSLSLESRFDLAYNAAHALALAALRFRGYRSESRYLVFQCLQHTLDLPSEQWRVLDQAHRKRNLAEYEGDMDVDEQLVAALLRVARESVRLLPTILSEAHAAGRAVVLTSDHGHALEADGVKLPGDGGGRWRSAASPATELEIEIEGTRVQAATGLKRIVVPWSETVRYGSKKNGYHAGVSLQEAVVPVGVFVGPGEKLDGWEPFPESYPPWWRAEPRATA